MIHDHTIRVLRSFGWGDTIMFPTPVLCSSSSELIDHTDSLQHILTVYYGYLINVSKRGNHRHLHKAMDGAGLADVKLL